MVIKKNTQIHFSQNGHAFGSRLRVFQLSITQCLNLLPKIFFALESSCSTVCTSNHGWPKKNCLMLPAKFFRWQKEMTHVFFTYFFLFIFTRTANSLRTITEFAWTKWSLPQTWYKMLLSRYSIIASFT